MSVGGGGDHASSGSSTTSATSAPAKVAGQVLAAMVLVFLGVTMYHFKVPFAGYIVLSPSVLRS